MPRDRPGKTPEIPEKKVRFFSGFFSARRKDTAYFCKKFGKKFPRKSGKFRKISEIPENFGKKSAKNDDFPKIQPSFKKRVLKRTFLRS